MLTFKDRSYYGYWATSCLGNFPTNYTNYHQTPFKCIITSVIFCILVTYREEKGILRCAGRNGQNSSLVCYSSKYWNILKQEAQLFRLSLKTLILTVIDLF